MEVCKDWDRLGVRISTQLPPKLVKYCTDDTLARFSDLQFLQLHKDTLITDNGLSMLVKLSHLDLGCASLISDSSVSLLKNLVSFTVKHPEITDNSLKYLTNLTELRIRTRCDNITDIGVFPLTNLTLLEIKKKSSISDAAILRLTKLRSLCLNPARRCITDASLSCLLALNTLQTNYNKDVTDKSLFTLTNLTSLEVSNTNISDCSVSLLTNLTFLNLRADNAITLKALKPLTELREVRFPPGTVAGAEYSFLLSRGVEINLLPQKEEVTADMDIPPQPRESHDDRKCSVM